MTTISSVKRATVSAVCIALCYVLPVAFHSFGLGNAFSPMHLPVLLCGLVCGGGYGAVCAVAGPVLSSVLSGMPTATALVSMVPELVTYGLVSGLLMQRLRTGKLQLDLYLSLIPAMILGRIVGGVAKALLISLLASGETFSLAIWVSTYFAGTFGGIVTQLIVLPVMVTMLMKAKLIPNRY